MSSIDSTAPRTPLTTTSASPSETGLFVTFEGGDGGGKSTQIPLLEKWLRGEGSPFAGADVTVTKEPGGSPLGAQIRELILHSDHVSDRAEALLYAADRAHHVESVVRPALASGGIVIADRYLDSSVAYQGAGRALDPNDVYELSMWATEGLLPHLTFLLDVSPETLAQRREAASLDRLEREGHEFHEAVRAAFLDLARREPERWIVIDASQSVEDVHAEITQRFADWVRVNAHTLTGAAEHPVEGTTTPDSLL
ncbi:dTMP kinase [Dermabacter hominis]|uniref:dTMP kinase n=1 Tax=Dermabacter hominis TaxID=36740 RepID=UPI0021AE5172|nr:dTMP kinase [Dermabacter hominis]MCT2025048.1 dTMP kinase [Dermabacter hominis]